WFDLGLGFDDGGYVQCPPGHEARKIPPVLHAVRPEPPPSNSEYGSALVKAWAITDWLLTLLLPIQSWRLILFEFFTRSRSGCLGLWTIV
ncbi:unnamed protein product, partial [Musa acuminata subsp. burmannicoides]